MRFSEEFTISAAVPIFDVLRYSFILWSVLLLDGESVICSDEGEPTGLHVDFCVDSGMKNLLLLNLGIVNFHFIVSLLNIYCYNIIISPTFNQK